MAQSWKIDPANGDYVLENGVPVQTDSLQVPAYIRLKAPRTRWLHAPDNEWGSDFWAYRSKLNTGAPAITRSIAERALQPIVDDGRASEVDVQVADQGATTVDLVVSISDAQGERENDVELIPIGR